MNTLPGLARAQNRGLTKEPIRGWGGEDPIAKIAAVESLTEQAVCPDCHILSKLVHLSGKAILAQGEVSIIPCNLVSDVLRKSKCILCTISGNAVVRSQEAMAGHIWFLIGDSTDECPPPQEALNQHYWSVIAQPLPRHRLAARNHILDLAASKAFGSLHLPHTCITKEEREWLISEMTRAFGPSVHECFDEESRSAFIDQYGVSLLMSRRTPKPEWMARVRFVPTPEGVEAFRGIYLVAQPPF